MITVVLNGYKRGDNLNEQMEALKNQTLHQLKFYFGIIIQVIMI